MHNLDNIYENEISMMFSFWLHHRPQIESLRSSFHHTQHIEIRVFVSPDDQVEEAMGSSRGIPPGPILMGGGRQKKDRFQL